MPKFAVECDKLLQNIVIIVHLLSTVHTVLVYAWQFVNKQSGCFNFQFLNTQNYFPCLLPLPALSIMKDKGKTKT